MDVYCHGKSKLLLENAFQLKTEYSQYISHLNLLIKCPHPLHGGTPFTAIGNIYIPYVIMENNKMTGIEPSVLKVVADYFKLPLTLRNEQFEVYPYIEGKIGNGPVRRVIF